MTDKNSHFDTRAIHAGQDFDPTTGAVIPPVYLTSTFVQKGIGQLRNGYEYGRASNPTRTALQDLLASLEGGRYGLSFASGLAAEDALLRAALKPGDHVVLGNDVYGGTHRLINRIHGAWGITNTVVDMSNLFEVQSALKKGSTKILWIETPSNPLMKISDIAELSDIGHQAGAIVVVDNTFASPALQQPLALGADVVVHSTTKYLGGAVSGPMDAWLTVRGVKTLSARVERHSRNAQAIAEHLVGNPAVERVYYPGLPDHPGHELAKQQMSGFGGMLSLAIKGGAKAARRFAESTVLFQLAESLGGVESLVNYPAEMTHASVKGTPLEVPDNVVRLSVGIESVDDLIADLDAALARSQKRAK
jgi:cystathionine gamma-synthase